MHALGECGARVLPLCRWNLLVSAFLRRSVQNGPFARLLRFVLRVLESHAV